MPIDFICTCGQTLSAPESQAGWRVRCPRCNAEVTVPSAGGQAPQAASTPEPGAAAGGPTPAAAPGMGPYPAPAPGYYGPTYAPLTTSGMAIASLVLGIFPCGLTAILAIIFGHLALSEINKSNGTIGGRGMGIAGLVLGYIWAGLTVLYLIIVAIVVASAPHYGW